jgi:four helix bundle protein
MKINRFEEIEAWQEARKLANEVYRVSRSTAFQRDFALRDQIRKAAISCMSNIAEGYGRSSREFIRFLR